MGYTRNMFRGFETYYIYIHSCYLNAIWVAWGPESGGVREFGGLRVCEFVGFGNLRGCEFGR